MLPSVVKYIHYIKSQEIEGNLFSVCVCVCVCKICDKKACDTTENRLHCHPCKFNII